MTEPVHHPEQYHVRLFEQWDSRRVTPRTDGDIGTLSGEPGRFLVCCLPAASGTTMYELVPLAEEE